MMLNQHVGISALALRFPSIKRTKDYFRTKYPDLVKNAELKNLAKLMSLGNTLSQNEFDLEMLPYVSDPFRGTVEKWILGPGESSRTLENHTGKDVLDSAKLAPDDVDLLLVASFLPEEIGFGNAAFVARQLGLKCGAWNLDASCCSTPIALQTACALVQAGMYRNVLVVISCTYSRFFDEDDTLSWFFSDGAGGFLVSSLQPKQGILGTKTVNTSILCDQFSFKLADDEQENPRLRCR